MKILVGLFIAGLMLVACSSTPSEPSKPKYWTKPNFTTQEFKKDKYECMKESQSRMSSSSIDPYKGSALSIPITDWSLFDACMEARGWTLK